MNASPYPSIQNIPEVAGQNAQAAQSVQQPGNMGIHPILQALKIIGSSINAGKQSGNPRSASQSQAFSGLLQSLASPELSQPGQPQTGQQSQPMPQQQPPMQAPVTPQPVAPQPQAPQAQGTQGGQQAPASRPGIQRRPLSQSVPFGQTAGSRLIGKQPINI